MNITRINYDTPIKQDEIRVMYDGVEKISITKYRNGSDFSTKPESEKLMKELANSNTSKIEEFLKWIIETCGVDCSVNVEGSLFDMLV